MIKKSIIFSIILLLSSCGSIDLLLTEKSPSNKIKNNTSVILDGVYEERFAKELFSFFGNNAEGKYILITSFSEKKENMLVKQNQVAEKISYELTVVYNMFYKNRGCKIFNKKITSNFSFIPKSFGYNFGADRSFEKLYKSSIRKNIRSFVDLVPNSTDCLL